MGTPRWPETHHDLKEWTWNAGGIPIMIRSTPLSDEEWIKIIEGRVEKIKRYLDSMTLKRLRDVPCLRRESRLDDLSYFRAQVESVDDELSLDTQGIFKHPYQSRVDFEGTGFQGQPGEGRCPNGYGYIWGLTRKGPLWILAKLEWKGTAGYKWRGAQEGTKITIQQASLPEIIDVTKTTYEEIWRQLGEQIIEWMVDRHRIYDQALKLANAVVAEEHALKELRENLLPKTVFWYCNNCETRGVYQRKRGEEVPKDVYPHSGLEWVHRTSSPECSKEVVRVCLNVSDLTHEEQERVTKFRESNPDQPRGMF